MVNRKERPKCRNVIEHYCEDYGWTLKELYDFTRYYMDDDPDWTPIFWITNGLKTQLRKMLEEEYYINIEKVIIKWDEDMKGYPTVYATEVNNSWVFPCPYCKTKHSHGCGEGHRQAHCSGDSPLKETGYYLKLKKTVG
ncbi:MAG: hypothetical protein ACTSQY_09335 [Candidatus Odinarchaeia archaeon]